MNLRLDWEQTGWCRFLPLEGEVLWGLLCDATEEERDGDLDELLEWQRALTFPMFGQGTTMRLDAAIGSPFHRWDQHRLCRIFGKAGYRYPRTVRDIAELGVRLGLYRRSMRGRLTRWRVPRALPFPAEVLPMSERERRAEDEHRWYLAGSRPAARIAGLLLDEGEAARTVTSVGCLAARLGCEPETVRRGLAHLCDKRFERLWSRPAMRIYLAGDGGRCRRVDPERLDTIAVCVLVPHWRKLWRQHGLLWQLEGKGGCV
ncbi:MAG TPA: DUF6042 family protein [Stackebrandtia sp.]|jgi:hypothetical protein|uniref:DUF6042 family protein n=1 Tax=Stackebrandtia sp. TaxID=2023065 RepID=UPI002D4641F6|nr:DUF6042 family protein [Stackebrandtia sp.]HZE41448.1 DUF6042 family protein [Stackebrandtia sp.]